MTRPKWHLERAKATLKEWYLVADNYLRQEQFFLNLVVPSTKYAGIVGGKALHCKTAGLVWHDRYKMLLDCKRPYKIMKEIQVNDNQIRVTKYTHGSN